MRDTMSGFFLLARTAIEQRLGRCSRCIRLSVILTGSSVALFAAFTAAGAPKPLILVAAAPVIAFAGLSAAHGIAYLVREPVAATGCTPCAKKARAIQRAARKRRLFSWFHRPVRHNGRHTRTSNRHTTATQSLQGLSQSVEALPRADQGLLSVIKASPEYQSIVSRLADADPVDTWREDVRNHFLYRLNADADGAPSEALFVARWEDYDLLSAVVITPSPNGGEARIVDLRVPETIRTVSLS